MTMRTVAVFGIKGGVGKTTVAVNLAYASAAISGRRTLLWDLDGQGAASFILGVDEGNGRARKAFASTDLKGLIQETVYENLDLLPADTSLRHLEKHLAEAGAPRLLKKLLKSLESDYDRVILDCPPGLGGLSEQVFRAVDLIVMPMLPAPLSERAYEQLVAHLADNHGGSPEIIPVFSMVDRRKKLHADTVDTAKRRIAIPYNSAIEQMSVNRAPIGAIGGSSPAAVAFAQLWSRVERALVKKAAA